MFAFFEQPVKTKQSIISGITSNTLSFIILFFICKPPIYNKVYHKSVFIAIVFNVSRISLAYYENDERTIPIDAIKKLALHYKVSTDFILGLSSAETDDITDNQISKTLGITSQSINLIRTANELANCEAKWKNIISDKIKKGSLTAEDFNVGNDIERASNIIKSIETLNYSQTIFLNKAKEIIDYVNQYKIDETEV